MNCQNFKIPDLDGGGIYIYTHGVSFHGYPPLRLTLPGPARPVAAGASMASMCLAYPRFGLRRGGLESALRFLAAETASFIVANPLSR